MGTFTGEFARVIRSTGHGSDFYGLCDQCGKHMSETFVSTGVRIYQRADGQLYHSAADGGAYGHKECLDRFGPHVQHIRK